jgi:hypothetical protein
MAFYSPKAIRNYDDPRYQWKKAVIRRTLPRCHSPDPEFTCSTHLAPSQDPRCHHRTLPLGRAFYDEIFRRGQAQGMVLFEQDYLSSIANSATTLTSTDVLTGARWLASANRNPQSNHPTAPGGFKP